MIDWSGRAAWQQIGEALRRRDFAEAQRLIDELAARLRERTRCRS